MVLAACSGQATVEPTSSASTTPVAQRAAAVAGITDCGGSINGNYDTASVKVVNQSSQRLLLNTFEIDCSDWASTANPSRLNVDLASGSASSSEQIAYRSIPQYGGQIRPWNWNVSAYDPEEGFVIEGKLASRPTYKFVKASCYTSSGGMTACDGGSLCAASPDGKSVATSVPMRNILTKEESTLYVTTYCTDGDSTSRIVFSDAPLV
jgi:hypothetical protein